MRRRRRSSRRSLKSWRRHVLRGALFVPVSLIISILLFAMPVQPATTWTVVLDALLLAGVFALAAALWDRWTAYFLSTGTVLAALYLILQLFAEI